MKNKKWSKKDDVILRLAYLLNQERIKTGTPCVSLFEVSDITEKSLNSVEMKLYNIQFLETGEGLKGYSQQCKKAFDTFK